MGWLANISDRDRWAQDPGTTAGQAALCLIGFPFCLAYEVGGQSAELAKQARVELSNVQARARSMVTDAGDAAAEVIGSTTRPLEQAASIAMWTAIGIIAVTIAVIVMVALAFRLT